MRIPPMFYSACVFAFLVVCFSIGLSAQIQTPAISITVIVDQYPFREGLMTGQGFACLVQGTEKNVLFDTGGKGSAVLLRNFTALNIDPKIVEVVIISREDSGGAGGLLSFLAQKGQVQVFLPASASSEFIKEIEAVRGIVVPVKNPVSLCEAVFSTGEIGTEQSLVIDTPKGLVILTGCAQSGIVGIVEKAKSVMPKNIHMVLGGFQVADQTASSIKAIVSRLHQLGVENIGSTYCTGPKTVELLKREFGKNYISIGVGQTIEIR